MKTKTIKNSWLGYQASSLSLTAFLTLSALSQTSYAAIALRYDAAASGANSYIYDGTGRDGRPISVELVFNFWDDSAGSFTTPTFTPNGVLFQGTIDLSIDPGDYMSITHRILDENGSPAILGVYDEDHPAWTAGDSTKFMSTAFYVLGANPYLEETTMIYDPDGSDFYDGVSGGGDGIISQLATRDSTTGVNTFDGSGITRGTTSFGAGFDDINNLTGADTVSYQFAGLLPDGHQRGTVIDQVTDPDTTTGGFTWHLANTGTNSIAAGTLFGLTMDGAIATPVPEPSSTALLGLTSLALVLRRKRS